MLVSCSDLCARSAGAQLPLGQPAIALRGCASGACAWPCAPPPDRRVANGLVDAAHAPSGCAPGIAAAPAACSRDTRTLWRGMTWRPRNSSSSAKRGLPVASAMARWKAKSSLTAPSPRRIAASMARKRRPIGSELLRRDALGGQRRRLDLDRQAQLHHLQHVADRAQAVGIDAEGNAAGVGGDEGARALAGRHQALRAQRRHRLAHDGAADPHGRHQFLLGRQPRAGRQPAAADLAGDARRRPPPSGCGQGAAGRSRAELVSAVRGG